VRAPTLDFLSSAAPSLASPLLPWPVTIFAPNRASLSVEISAK
jgi:hypothetical protein